MNFTDVVPFFFFYYSPCSVCIRGTRNCTREHRYLLSRSSTAAHQSSSLCSHTARLRYLKSHTGSSHSPPPGTYQRELKVEEPSTVAEAAEKEEEVDVSAEAASSKAGQ